MVVNQRNQDKTTEREEIELNHSVTIATDLSRVWGTVNLCLYCTAHIQHKVVTESHYSNWPISEFGVQNNSYTTYLCLQHTYISKVLHRVEEKVMALLSSQGSEVTA